MGYALRISNSPAMRTKFLQLRERERKLLDFCTEFKKSIDAAGSHLSIDPATRDRLIDSAKTFMGHDKTGLNRFLSRFALLSMRKYEEQYRELYHDILGGFRRITNPSLLMLDMMIGRKHGLHFTLQVVPLSTTARNGFVMFCGLPNYRSMPYESSSNARNRIYYGLAELLDKQNLSSFTFESFKEIEKDMLEYAYLVHEDNPVFFNDDEGPGPEVRILPEYMPLFPREFLEDPSRFIESRKDMPRLVAPFRRSISTIFTFPYDFSRVKKFSVRNGGKKAVLVSKRVDVMKVRYPEEEIDTAERIAISLLEKGYKDFRVQKFIGIAYGRGNFYLLSLYEKGAVSLQESLLREETGIASDIERLRNGLGSMVPDLQGRNILVRKMKRRNRYTLIDFESSIGL